MYSIDEIQSQLSAKQLDGISGPLIISPVKAIISLVQTIVGIGTEVFFGVMASVTDFSCLKDLSQLCDELSNKGASIRTKGGKNFLSAGYNLVTFGKHGYWLEEALDLRYRKITTLKP